MISLIFFDINRSGMPWERHCIFLNNKIIIISFRPITSQVFPLFSILFEMITKILELMNSKCIENSYHYKKQGVIDCIHRIDVRDVVTAIGRLTAMPRNIVAIDFWENILWKWRCTERDNSLILWIILVIKRWNCRSVWTWELFDVC